MLWKYKGRLTAAAALVAVAFGLVFLTVLTKTATPAYGLDQTVQAYKGVRYIHLEEQYPSLPPGDQNRQMWVEIDENGQLKRMRIEMLVTDDGPKAVVWEKGKATVWMAAKKVLVTVGSPEMADAWCKTFFDPKLAVEQLLRDERDGKIEIDRSKADDGQAIKLTVTYKEGSGAWAVYLVEPETKLVTDIEKHVVRDGAEIVAKISYSDYNKPIDPLMWTFVVPSDVVVIDETTQVIGLEKGAMTDEEITVEVARQFFEALIARDYAKAGQLLSGVPAKKIEEWFGKRTFTRIIAIGKPAPQPIPLVGGTVVSFEVEEAGSDGAKSVWKGSLAIRPVGKDQPTRWTIHGGI